MVQKTDFKAGEASGQYERKVILLSGIPLGLRDKAGEGHGEGLPSRDVGGVLVTKSSI